MKLYHVNAEGFDGEPHALDLWVRAESPQEAVLCWQDYYERQAYDDTDDCLPTSVDELPDAPEWGAIPWATVLRVWERPQ